MNAIVYTQTGPAEVLKLVEREVPEVGPGQVRVRIVVSGVNPTDWKVRRGSASGMQLSTPQVPNQDGAGVVDATGTGVSVVAVGQRVWGLAGRVAAGRRDGAGIRSAARASGRAASRQRVV